MRRNVILSAVIAAGAFAAVTAAPAFADETDDAFISALQGAGIPISTSADAVALAKSVCEYVSAGQPAEQVAVEVSGPANWSEQQSIFFVSAATKSYCP